jgi:hypothetical protein
MQKFQRMPNEDELFDPDKLTTIKEYVRETWKITQELKKDFNNHRESVLIEIDGIKKDHDARFDKIERWQSFSAGVAKAAIIGIGIISTIIGILKYVV